MADEITLKVYIDYAKSGVEVNRDITDSFDVTNAPIASGVQNIGTSSEAIVINDLGSNQGYAFFHNLDATNYVEIGTYVSSVFYPAIKLKAGEFALVRLSPALTYRALANTAAINLEYVIFGD